MSLSREIQGRTKSDVGWLVLVTALVVASGMAYALWWPDLVRHQPNYWVVPGDLWGSFRGAHWVDWGGFSYIYSSKTALVTLPGFEVILAPLAALSSHLGLTESAPGILPPVPKPTAWLLVGPFLLACSALLVFASDALARLFSVSRRRRRLLAVGVGAAVWPALAMWGHGEDVLALGFAIYAIVALVRGRLGAAGWLFGAALAMQLYVVVLIPLFVAVVGRRKAVALLARMSVLPGFLFVAVVIPNPRASWHALFDQPNFPVLDHATPWVLLAPSLGHQVVAAGPGRIVGLVLAAAVGALGIRFRADTAVLVWLAGIILGLRCLFESVMDPYYVMPVVVMALIVATNAPPWRALGVAAAGAGLTVLTFYRLDMWTYWGGTAAVMAALVVLAWPRPLPLLRAKRSNVGPGIFPVIQASGTADGGSGVPAPTPAVLSGAG